VRKGGAEDTRLGKSKLLLMVFCSPDEDQIPDENPAFD